PAKVSPILNASPSLLKLRWSSLAKVEFLLNLPVNNPLANGRRTIIPTPFSCACGNNSDTSFWRNILKMTCKLSSPSCCRQINPSSTVSTLAPKCRINPSFCNSLNQSNIFPSLKYCVGIQCSCIKSKRSTLRRSKEPSTQLLSTSLEYLSG